jgi:hypothetical protein
MMFGVLKFRRVTKLVNVMLGWNWVGTEPHECAELLTAPTVILADQASPGRRTML